MGKSDRAILREVFDGLKMSRTPVLGLVANGVKQYLPTSYNYYERYYAPDDTRVHSQ
jgi:Mrp family chromosome partitioning ATPase